MLISHTQTFAQRDVSVLESRLKAIVDSFYVADSLPGVIVGVWTPDITFKYAIGKGDLKTGADRTIQDRFRIGSITKTFVATIVFQLIEEGKVGLDEKISKLFPDFPNGENITWRHVLDHTSGIANYLEDPAILKSFTYDRLDKYTTQQLYEKTKSLPPMFEPGKSWSYSNGNYLLLGLMIEKLTGSKIEEVISSRILKPLNLNNTEFPTTPYMTGIYSHGYSDDINGNRTDVSEIDPSIGWAAGAMISTIDDLNIYAKALFDGTLVSDKMQKERLKFVDTEAEWLKCGLGIFKMESLIGHDGSITGYNSLLAYDPELNAAIIISVNEFTTPPGISAFIGMKIARALKY